MLMSLLAIFGCEFKGMHFSFAVSVVYSTSLQQFGVDAERFRHLQQLILSFR